MPKISVIIVTYNSEAHIYDCLEALYKYNDISDDLEVIIVDNCSKEFVTMKSNLEASYGKKLIILENVSNGGYGQGNNVGIRFAHAPIIMIMNPDVRLSMPLFSIVYNRFCKDERIVLYGLTQRNALGALGCSMAWTKNSNSYLVEPIRFLLCKCNIYIQKFMYISGACFFVRKKSFEDIGLFDENIFMYNEEDDIHGRLLKIKGSKIVYDRNLEYIHLHPPVSDYSKENYDWKKKDLTSLLYLSEKQGISKKKALSYAIKRANVSILCEKIKILFGKGNQKRLEYFSGWKDYLQELSLVV